MRWSVATPDPEDSEPSCFCIRSPVLMSVRKNLLSSECWVTVGTISSLSPSVNAVVAGPWRRSGLKLVDSPRKPTRLRPAL